MNISVKHSFSFPNSKIWKRFRAGIVLAAVLFTVLPRTFHVACYAAAAESGRYEWEDAPSPEEYDEVIAIVHTNDVHGFIEHEPYVKGFADQLKTGGKYDLVLTVSGGDVYTGGYVAAHGYDGELIPALMSRVYDVMTCGNNDERLPGNSYAVALLAALCESEGLHCLAGNRVIGDEPFDLKSYAESYEPVIGAADFAALYKAVGLRPDGSLDWSRLDLDSYAGKKGDHPMPGSLVMTTRKGTKLGVFGINVLGEPEILWKGTPTIETCQRLTDELRDEGCTAVVGITHIGFPLDDETLMETFGANDSNSVQVALHTTGIDAIVDAHSHTIINNGYGVTYGGTYINQAYAYGQAIGLMELYLKDGKAVAVRGRLVRDFSDITPDPEVQKMVDDIMARLDRDGFTTVLAHSSFHLNADRVSAKDEGGAVRMNETNLGDLVADGLLSIGKDMTDGKAEVALFPAYRMRSSLEPGDVNKGDICSVFATSIPVYEKQMNAQTLFEWISDSIKYAGIREYKYFRQISGMKVEYSAGEKENTIYRLTIGDTVIYENGAFCVDDDWSVDCVYGLTDQTNIDNSDPGNMLIPNNKELIERFCQYLEKEEETIYPDIIAPDGRIMPH